MSYKMCLVSRSIISISEKYSNSVILAFYFDISKIKHKVTQTGSNARSNTRSNKVERKLKHKVKQGHARM